MSKHYHGVTASDVAFIVSEVNRLTLEEVKIVFGIEILEEGKVFDPVYDKTFESVSEWAAFNIEQDDMEYEEHFSKDYDGEY